MKRYEGVGGAPGVARGRVVRLDADAPAIERLAIDDPKAECGRLDAARKAASDDIASVVAKAERDGRAADEVRILKAHRMILGDDEFYDEVKALIRDEAVDARWALKTVTERVEAQFSRMTNEYLRERARDIAQTGAMVVRRLSGGTSGTPGAGADGDKAVLVARDLAPSDTLRFDKGRLAGLVTEVGGVTSHTIILAKGLGIPAVTDIRALETFVDGADCLVDGGRGVVTLEPDAAAVAAYVADAEREADRRERTRKYIDLPGRTADGVAVAVQGNLAEPGACAALVAAGCEGVGLFRSEFLFMNREDYPSEEEQYAAYSSVVRSLAGRPLIIRTLDIGGDKRVDYMGLPKEDNPFLGYRAVRISLDRPEILDAQLRAILRAGALGDVAAMIPMIVSVEELEAVREYWRAAMDGLAADGIPHRREAPLGIMVETPAAAVSAEDLAARCDFFSIGTNDLTQYVTACDRLNPKVRSLYDGYNPAVLRLMNATAAAGRRHGIPVCVCGEMGADTRALPLLVGMGVTKLSVAGAAIPSIKAALAGIDGAAARELLDRVLAAPTARLVRELLDDFARRRGEESTIA